MVFCSLRRLFSTCPSECRVATEKCCSRSCFMTRVKRFFNNIFCVNEDACNFCRSSDSCDRRPSATVCDEPCAPRVRCDEPCSPRVRCDEPCPPRARCDEPCAVQPRCEEPCNRRSVFEDTLYDRDSRFSLRRSSFDNYDRRLRSRYDNDCRDDSYYDCRSYGFTRGIFCQLGITTGDFIAYMIVATILSVVAYQLFKYYKSIHPVESITTEPPPARRSRRRVEEDALCV